VGTVKRDDTGEPPDFETFYRAEFEGLVRSMFLLVTDLDEAQERAQEAMVRVFERWDRVGAMESPGGYLYRVAVNLHRRRVRSLAVRARRLVTLAAGQRDVENDPGRQELADAIASLSMRLREAFMLVDWLGMGSEEAGRILGIEAASVRSRVHRARRELRAQLNLEEPTDG
jgi:RNA polymerase sigma-70 factor (ECF subfamily)